MRANSILAGAVFTVLAFLTSCTATKDLHAVNRVISSRPLLAEVKPYVDSLWPCVIDTSTVFIPGKIDSVAYPVYNVIVLDSNIREQLLDSLAKDSTANDKKIIVAYNKGFKDAIKLMSAIKIPTYTPDTLLFRQINNRKVDIANAARLSAEQQATVKSVQADIYKRERNILSLVILALTLVVAFILYARLKL